ncbi:MAG: McrB family protein [Candidatus Woesearchaeota archaeon]
MDSKYILKKEILEEEQKTNKKFEELKNDGKIKFITFHPSYSYEEFIEGITIKDKPENNSLYERKDGFFKKFCADALKNVLKKDKNMNFTWKELFKEYKKHIENKSKEDIKQMWKEADRFVLIIDEINRGDMSKIFGELITLLESDKRLGEDNAITTNLPISGDEFGIPPNVYLLGTMNTADRSIALIDVALRRRFGFVEMPPNLYQLESDFNKSDNFENSLLKKSINKLKEINQKIRADETLGKEKEIGHSFFYSLNNKNDDSLINIWIREIFPLLEEYYYGEKDKLKEVCGSVYLEEEFGFTKETNAIIKWLNGN